MGLNDVRSRAIECLRSGTIQHAARDNIDEKNLLKTGAVTVDLVIKLMNATKGSEYSTTSHVDAPDVDVHVCKPMARAEGEDEKSSWYLKFYFIDPDLIFISVHKSHVPKRQSSSRKR